MCACGLVCTDACKSLRSAWQASGWGTLEKCWDSSSFLLSPVTLSFFLSSQGMQGWNTQRRERGKNSQKMTVKALFLSQILLCTHSHPHTILFCWFCMLYFERASIFVLDFPAFAARPAHSCMQIHAHTNTLMRPFTYQLCDSLLLYEAITQLPPLWQSSQITSIWIPPLLLPLYLLPLARPCSIWPPSPLSLWLRSHSVIIQHRGTKKEENPGISIHTLRRSINLGCTFSVATVVLFLAPVPTYGHKRGSVSVWSVCKTNRWHHGRKAPPASLV